MTALRSFIPRSAATRAGLVAALLATPAMAGPPPTCGDAGAGDCWSPTGTPGCDHADCCATVCAVDSWCCDTEWDSYCADLALQYCGTGLTGACCLPDQACLADTTQLDCENMGGYYKGDGLSCDDVDCAVMPIYETEDPFGGFLGVWGPDVSEEQSVAVRITPDADYTLESISVWMMNNDTSGTDHGIVTIAIVEDDDTLGFSAPTGEVLESWTFTISAIGWEPRLESVESQLAPLLEGGLNYWIVAESDAPRLLNPVWTVASPGNGFSTTTDPATGQWQPGVDAAVPATIVMGRTVANPADLTGDGQVNVFDLLELLGAWGACPRGADCPADLTGDSTVNVFDLLELLANWG